MCLAKRPLLCPQQGRGAAAMFMGEYNYTMDEKGRLNLPPRFREQLEQGMVLTRWMDQCLVLFPQQEWERICQKLQSRSMVKTRDLQRFLFALASEAAVDKQGADFSKPGAAQSRRAAKGCYPHWCWHPCRTVGHQNLARTTGGVRHTGTGSRHGRTGIIGEPDIWSSVTSRYC